MRSRRAQIWIVRAFACAVTLSNLCCAETLKVRVVNAANGQALTKQSVTLQFLGENPTTVSSLMSLQTDQHGEVQFDVPHPIPAHLSVRVILASEHWNCGCWVMANTTDVLQHGLTQLPPAKHGESSKGARAGPGEIVIGARPFTFFERLLYPFEKE